MFENWHFETQMKLFLANFWNLAWVFFKWKNIYLKKLDRVFQNILICELDDLLKKKELPNIGST